MCFPLVRKEPTGGRRNHEVHRGGRYLTPRIFSSNPVFPLMKFIERAWSFRKARRSAAEPACSEAAGCGHSEQQEAAPGLPCRRGAGRGGAAAAAPRPGGAASALPRALREVALPWRKTDALQPEKGQVRRDAGAGGRGGEQVGGSERGAGSCPLRRGRRSCGTLGGSGMQLMGHLGRPGPQPAGWALLGTRCVGFNQGGLS